jgi:hypothetical protein
LSRGIFPNFPLEIRLGFLNGVHDLCLKYCIIGEKPENSISGSNIAWKSAKNPSKPPLSVQGLLDSCLKHRRVPLVIDKLDLPTPAFPMSNTSDPPTDFRR